MEIKGQLEHLAGKMQLKLGARPPRAQLTAPSRSAFGGRRTHCLVYAPREAFGARARRTTAGAAALPKTQLHRSGLERLVAWCLGGENGLFCGLEPVFGQKEAKSGSDKRLSATKERTFVTDKRTSATDKRTFVTNKRTSATDKGTSVTKERTFVVKKRQLMPNWQVTGQSESLVSLCHGGENGRFSGWEAILCQKQPKSVFRSIKGTSTSSTLVCQTSTVMNRTSTLVYGNSALAGRILTVE